jgi:hypothetical protein
MINQVCYSEGKFIMKNAEMITSMENGGNG